MAWAIMATCRECSASFSGTVLRMRLQRWISLSRERYAKNGKDMETLQRL